MNYQSFLETLEGGDHAPMRESKRARVSEAAYSSKNIIPLLNKLGKVFGKQFGGDFQVMGPEKYKRSDGEKGIGYRMLNPQGFQIRVNFQGLKTAMSDEFSRDAMYIKGIDYWDSSNTNWGRATLNVTFSRDCNILQIYKRLLQLIKSGKKGKFTASDLNAAGPVTNESRVDEVNSAQRAAFLKSKGLKSSMGWKSVKKFEDYAREQGVLDEWYALIETGAPEVNSTSEGLQQAEKKLNETQYSDPNTVFSDIEQLTNFVARSGTARSLIICGQGGLGKCLPRWAKVPTPTGWTTMGEIQVGDEVIAKDGSAVKVLEKYEQTGHTIYRLHLNDGQHLDVDDDQILHVEIMERAGSKGIVNITLADLRQYLAEHPNRYATIPYCSPVSCFPEQELKIDPYFLGLLLGDGCITTNTPMLSNVDPDIITGVHKLVLEQYENMGMNFDDRCTYRFSYHGAGKYNPLTQQLKDIGVQGCNSYTKFIPFEYKRGSIEQRMELVRGLMDSDGYITKTGYSSFATCSKQMAEDFTEVIRSLGGRARIREKHTKSQFGTPCLSYDVSFKLPPELGSVAKYSKLKTERYEEVLSKKVWCKKRRIASIETLGVHDTACILIDHPDHLYLAEEYVPVHNTFHATKTLQAFGSKGRDWTYHGAMQVTPNSFFSTVFNERNKVICFDEADAILGNSDIVVMLKPLLDTSGDHRCEWAVQTAPMGTRSDDEIEGYSANFARGVQDGNIDPVWSRSISDAERVPEFYDGKLYQEALSKLISPENESQYKEAVTDLIRIDPDNLAKDLTKKLQDEYGLDEKRSQSVANSIADNFRTFLDHVDDLKTYVKKNNEVPTARYPSIFFFNGKMIFISNMPAAKLDQAVMSRSLFIDLQLRATDIKNRIVTILDSDPSYDDVRDALKAHLNKLEASASATNQTEAATYTSPALKRNGKQLTVRYMKLAADMIRNGVPNWEELAAKYC